jgi:hypothetical protein
MVVATDDDVNGRRKATSTEPVESRVELVPRKRYGVQEGAAVIGRYITVFDFEHSKIPPDQCAPTCVICVYVVFKIEDSIGDTTSK